MCVDLLTFYNKDYVCELWVIDNLSHVLYQTIDCFVIDFILFKLSNVENAYIVKPLTSIEAAKYKELFCPNHTSCMSLSACWSLFTFNGMTPSHSVCIEYIEVIAWDDLFERAASSIIPSKEIDLVSN